MAYTLTQVRPMLTAAELQLFEHSRAEPIKALSAAQLRTKITRARTLRDKFRDLYRRQTVETQRAPARKRSATGGDNARTQQKSEVFAEVLTRFEAQLEKAQAREDKEKAAKEKAKAQAAADKAKTKAAADKEKAAKKTKPATPSAPKKSAAKRAAAKASSTAAATGSARKPAGNADSGNGATKSSAKGSGKGAAKKKPGATPSIGDVTQAVAGAVERKQSKAASARTQTAVTGAKALSQAPTDVPAVAEQRLNPLKADPRNQKIHAQSGSQVRRAQAKKDAR